jgi:mannose-1-phosphate guanylyltransferase
MTPTRPETGYGYVQCGPETELAGVRSVLRFQEKPPLELAREYVSSGDYLWNASVFVWRTDVFLTALRQYSPEVYANLQLIAKAWDTPERDAVLAEVWPTLPRLAVEYAVMEPAAADGLVGTVPGDFGWHDIGDFNALGDILPADESNLAVVPGGDGQVRTLDSSGLVVFAGGGRPITAVGVRDLVIVDTGDAVLVCDRERAQDVKALTDVLRANGLEHLL